MAITSSQYFVHFVLSILFSNLVNFLNFLRISCSLLRTNTLSREPLLVSSILLPSLQLFPRAFSISLSFYLEPRHFQRGNDPLTFARPATV